MFIEHNSQELFYRTPFGAVPSETEIELRIAVSGIGIPHGVKCVICKDGDVNDYIDMSYTFTLCEKSIYSCKIIMPDKGSLMWYCFCIDHDGGCIWYGNNKDCLGGIGSIYESEPVQKFQITVYDKSYITPEWFRKSVAYQIFPDRFYNGNDDGSFCGDRTDIIKRNWNDTPYHTPEQFGGEYLSNDFFGGNLKGIIKKLPYIKELGISVIYLNPIFKAYSNHRYDTGNYEEIDSTLGTEEDFKKLCHEAGKLGIKIILDGVFNHTGSNSKYFNKNGEYDSLGAYQSKDSPYRDWFCFGKTRDEYDCWWGMKTLPHTNEKSETFQKYILSGKDAIIKKWLRLGASGWRLDVVDELPGFFVKMLRENVKEVSADNVIIGEVWEDASNKVSYSERREYFQGKELDSVMNYPLRNALIDAALMRISTDTLNRRIMSLIENYPKQSLYSCLNMISGHDVERILTLMGGGAVPETREKQADMYLDGEILRLAEKRTLAVVAMQMTLPGVPCVYYGDEIGMQGCADPFCRKTFDWNKAENDYSQQFKKWIELRNSSEVFTDGEFTPLYTIGNIYAFARYTDNQKYVIIASFSPKSEQIRLDAARLGITHMESVFDEEIKDSANGIHIIDMPEYSVKVFEA